MTGDAIRVPAGPSSWLRVRTAVIDRTVALLALPLLGPVIGILAWRVRRAEGPPSLLGLPRCGRGGRSFPMWKIRTMRAEAPDGSATGAIITSGGDDRIFPLGARLRRWRADELPQLLNVVKGDMGLIGPRPETPSLVDLDDPRWQAVLAARPGITGPTQLVVERWESAVLAAGSAEAVYRDQILPVKLAVDRWYVERATPLLDLAVGWSMVERFALGRDDTIVSARVRREVPEAAMVPRGSAGGRGA